MVKNKPYKIYVNKIRGDQQIKHGKGFGRNRKNKEKKLPFWQNLCQFNWESRCQAGKKEQPPKKKVNEFLQKYEMYYSEVVSKKEKGVDGEKNMW